MQQVSNLIQQGYSEMQSKAILLFIDHLKATGVTKDNVFRWQLAQIQNLDVVTADIIKLANQYTGTSAKDIRKLIKENGGIVASEMASNLTNQGQTSSGGSTVSPMLNNLYNTTKQQLDKYINEGLITKDINRNIATQQYVDIVNDTTNQVASGYKTFDEALNDAMYNLNDKGLNSAFTGKNGNKWSQETYLRQLLNTATHRAYNDARREVMDDFGIELCEMSQHMASRPACAFIQGRVVDMTQNHKHPRYPNVYDYGYQEPAGTDGINCTHIFYPFIEGISEPHGQTIDPATAIENGKKQQYQRLLERNVRKNKQKLEIAKKLDDKQGMMKYQSKKQIFQSKLRDHVKANKKNGAFRDYQREKTY